MPDAVGLARLRLSFLFFRYTFLLVYLVACLDCTLASARCLVSLVRASLNLPLHACLLSFTSSTCFTPFLCWARLCVLPATAGSVRVGCRGSRLESLPPMVVYPGDVEKNAAAARALHLQSASLLSSTSLRVRESLGNLRGSVGIWRFILYSSNFPTFPSLPLRLFYFYLV